MAMLTRSFPLVFLAAITLSARASTAAAPEIVTIAKADAKHVRQSEGTVLELKDGSLFLVWAEFDLGTGDSDFFPARLVSRVSRNGGRTWDDYRVVVENRPGDTNVYSANLLRRGDGAILLVFMRCHNMAKRDGRAYPPSTGFAWISTDEAKTFRPLSVLASERFLQTASACIRKLSSGRIVLPVNYEAGAKNGLNNHWEAGALYSDDDGATWQESVNRIDGPKRGVMEPHVAEVRDGRLLMMMRTQMGTVYQAESKDGGKSWSQGVPSPVQAPESCPDLIQVPRTGDLLLINTGVKFDPKWASHYGQRTPLSVRFSKDDGKTWSAPRHIDADPAWAYSNPGSYFTSKGSLLINYFACRYTPKGYMSNYPVDLKGAIVDLEWLYGK
jgi:sialidase-1